MDVKEFVALTLTQIAEGIADAQASVRKAGGIINPAHRFSGKHESHLGSYSAGANIYAVDFDVAVLASDSQQRGGDVKLEVAIFRAGGGGQATASSQSTNRVKFTIPLALPLDQETKTATDEKAAAAKRALDLEQEEANRLNAGLGRDD